MPSKRKPLVTIRSFGIYTPWSEVDKTLPQILEFTQRVIAKVDIEFGFIARIQYAKNQLLSYSIEHPGILDDAGRVRAPFDGEVYVRTNDWDFFLGDTIWLPLEDKLGTWRMSLELQGDVVAEKSFDLVLPADESIDGRIPTDWGPLG